MENYGQKYKEALSRAKGLMSRCVHNSDYKAIIYRAEDIESIFPELKESEDELTWLTKYIEEEAYSLSIDIRNNEDRIKLKKLQKAIAWLNKQDEKSVNIDIESMLSSYKQRLKSQGGVENSPIVNMCLTAFRHGVETALETIKKEEVDNGKFE